MFHFIYIIDSFTDLVEIFLTNQGIYAIILLLILDQIGIPQPIPGDIIVMYIGYKVATGSISYLMAFSSIFISFLIGSSILYYLSWRFGQRLVLNVGHYIHLNEKRLLVIEKKFKQYGPLVIIVGRHLPGFRIPTVVFSGMSKVKYQTFFLSTLISVLVWIPIYLSLGQKLGYRTIRLFKGHHLYSLIIFLPFALFVGSLVFSYLRSKKLPKK